MKNEFVPYNIALAMKELGFDEPCLAFHSKIYGLMLANTNSIIEEAGEVLAPLYHQAFRWFREKYSWNSWVDQGFTESFRYNICESNGSIIGVEGFSTYEEAELACLQKLIEIVNQNKDE